MNNSEILVQKVSTVVFVDTKTRALKLSAASATVVNPDGVPQVVLRFAADLGTLHQLKTGPVQGYERFSFEGMHLLVPEEGYTAQSSAGFVEHLLPYNRCGLCQTVAVVGLAGFPWMKKPALRPIKPFLAVIYRQEVSIRAVSSHGSSNPWTANAARVGIKAMNRFYPDRGFIMEGQSDETRVYELYTAPDVLKERGEFHPSFEEEHRQDVVGPNQVILTALWANARGDREVFLRDIVRVATASAFGLEWGKYVPSLKILDRVYGTGFLEKALAETLSLDNEGKFPKPLEAWTGVIQKTRVCPLCGSETHLGFSQDGSHCSCWGRNAAGEIVVCWEGTPDQLVEVAFTPVVDRERDSQTGDWERLETAAKRRGTFFKILSGESQWPPKKDEDDLLGSTTLGTSR